MATDNPLWFGYYPGDRPVKKSEKFLQIPQVDLSDMGVTPILDEAANAVTRPAEMPEQIWDWVKEDWKASFNIGASPSTGMGGHELYQFDNEEVADVKGAYVQINLVDLVNDPKKAVQKFAEKSLSTINPFGFQKMMEGSSEFWTDLDTNAEVAMWRDLVKAENASNAELGFGTVQKSFGPIELNNQGIFKGGKTYEMVGNDVNKDIKSVFIKNVGDVYQDVAESTLDFVSNKKSAFTRNGSYRKFSGSVINAAATELSQKSTDINQVFGADPKFVETSSRIQALIKENDVLSGVSSLNSAFDDVKKVVIKTGFSKTVDAKAVSDSLADLKKAASDIDTKISEVRASFMSGSPELDRFNRDIRELEDFANDVRGVAGKYAGKAGYGRFTSAEALVSDVTQLQNRLANGRYNGGIHDRYLEAVSRRYLEGPKSLLELSNLADPNKPGTPLMTKGFASLNTLNEYHSRVFWQEAGRDIVDAISDGNLGKNFVWMGSLQDVYVNGTRIPLSKMGLVKDRIQMFTPGYWTTQIMERTHRFGLVYTAKNEDRVLSPIFNNLPWIQKATFAESFDYHINGVKMGHINARFSGSKELGSFYSAWQAGEKGELIRGQVNGADAWITDAINNRQARFDLLNGKGNSGMSAGGMDIVLGGEKDWKNITNKADAMRAELAQKLGLKLDANGHIIDTGLDGDVNFAKLDAFFKRVKQRKANRALLDPFQEKYGALQIYASKLTQAQQWIYSKLGLDKVMRTFVHVKTVIARKISQFVAKIATKALAKLGMSALTAATGGLAAVLAPVIEKVIQVVVGKVIDVGKQLIGGLLKGDLIGSMDKLMDQAIKDTQKIFACGCAVPLALVLGVGMLFNNVLMSITPADRTPRTSTPAESGGYVPLPTGATTSGKIFTTGCFTGTSLTCASYPACHGNLRYWGGRGALSETQCTYSIPIISMTDKRGGWYGLPSGYAGEGNEPLCAVARPAFVSALDPTIRSPEITVANSGDKYGYAADYVPNCTNSEKWKIFAPSIDGVTSWDVKSSFQATVGQATVGCGVVMVGTGSDVYTLVLMHLETCPGSGTYTVGQAVGYVKTTGLPTGWGAHVHTELKKGAEVVKPELYL